MEQDIQLLRKALIKRARKQVQEKYSEKDVHIIRAISLLDDLDSAFNLLAEDCIEWHGAHFPELYSVVKDNDAFLKIVEAFGEKDKMNAKAVLQLVGAADKARIIEEKAGKSMGSQVPKAAMLEIRALAANALKLKEERNRLQAFIEVEMKALAPNFSKISGEVLGARVLAKAGGLEKLAFMPASTVQLLGAEKALFRHLRNKKIMGPKHGFIFGHQLVKTAASKNKGRVARALAGKMVIAARADFFGKKHDIATAMLAALEKRAKSMR